MRAALAAEGVATARWGVIFVDEARIAELNAAHRGKRRPPTCCRSRSTAPTSCRPGCPGSWATWSSVRPVAAGQGTPIETLLVHGALHLVGYDHEAG